MHKSNRIFETLDCQIVSFLRDDPSTKYRESVILHLNEMHKTTSGRNLMRMRLVHDRDEGYVLLIANRDTDSLAIGFTHKTMDKAMYFVKKLARTAKFSKSVTESINFLPGVIVRIESGDATTLQLHDIEGHVDDMFSTELSNP